MRLTSGTSLNPTADTEPLASKFSPGRGAAASFKVLIVDDDDSVKAACQQLAGQLEISIEAVDTFAAAQTVLTRNTVNLLLLDLDLTGSPGVQQLESLHASYPEMIIIVVTAAATVHTAVQAMRHGASDFLTAPLAVEELTRVLDRASQRRSHEVHARAIEQSLSSGNGMGSLVGHSPAMEKVYRMIGKVAFTTHPVLILGESGVGKELVARTIHHNGPHGDRPFVSVYCNELTAESMERERFGYAKGAFPSAVRRKAGLLVEADSGTVFFDGIDNLPQELQGKLVRVLQEHAVRPVGSGESVPFHARIIASASPDLAKRQAAGQFRRDLFFRLNVVNLRIPDLVERMEDLPALTDHILRRIRQETGVPYELDTSSREMLLSHTWPGNVRELESVLERACVMASSPFVTPSDFPSQLHRASSQSQVAAGSASLQPKPYRVTPIAELEKEAILNTIQQLRGDKLKAAKLLGIGKTTLYRKLKEYGIEFSGAHS